MGEAVKINKKHIIIAAIALLLLVSMFFILKTNKQNSLTDEQNSTLNGQNGLTGTNSRSGQNDPSEMLNSIQGGQTDTLGILTDTTSDSFMNINGDTFIMNNQGNSNLFNSGPGNSNLLNSGTGNNNLLSGNSANSNILNNNQNNSISGNISLTINPDNELSLLGEIEKEIEVAVIKPFVAPIPSNMRYMSGGTFYMGSPELEEEREEDETQHNVAVRPFYIGMYEVTQKEYEEVMKTNPSFFVGVDNPVENVTWFDAVEYCNNLSLRDGLPPAYNIINIGDTKLVTWDRSSIGYRLPTEAEWEYACRAGTTTAFNTGETITRRQANYFSDGPRKVGTFRPNSWGLHDMHGNVSEWCWDWYMEYDEELLTEANYAHAEGHRVFRGGSWFTLTMRVRSAFRDHYFPSYKSMNIGFRIVRNSN